MKKNQSNNEDSAPSEIVPENNSIAPTTEKRYLTTTEVNNLLIESKLTDYSSKREVVVWVSRLGENQLPFLDSLRHMDSRGDDTLNIFMLKKHIKSCMDKAFVDLIKLQK